MGEKKELLKLMGNKTGIFFLVMIGVFIFQSIFGQSNVIVGVAMITQALILMSVDMTAQFFKNFLKILGLNVALGICAYLVWLNPFLGVAINFFIIFVTMYLLMNDLTMPTYFPFMLAYLFMMIISPIQTGAELALRLGALVSGTILVMALQWIFNRNKSAKVTNDVFVSIAQEIIWEVDRIHEGKVDEGQNSKIAEEIRRMVSAINDRKRNSFFVSETAGNKLNIAFCLERMNLILGEIVELKEYEKQPDTYGLLFYQMTDMLKSFIALINKKTGQQDFEKKALDFYESCAMLKDLNTRQYEMIAVFEILKENILELQSLRSKKKMGVLKDSGEKKAPKEFEFISIIKENLKVGSIRFSFAFRVALVVSITMFAVDFLNLEYGRWMVFTGFVLLQPYKEDTKEKFKKRMIGTAIGVCIFAVGFSILQEASGRLILIMLMGYISTYMKAYDKMVICITVSALGSAALLESGPILAIDRIFYVILGGIIAMLVNHFILRGSVEVTTGKLKQGYLKLTNLLFEEVCIKKADDINRNKAINLILRANLIEEKLLFNNTKLEDKDLDVFIHNRRLLLNDLNFITQCRRSGFTQSSEIKNMMEALLHLMKKIEAGEDVTALSKVIEKSIQEKVKNCKNGYENVILITLTDILEQGQRGMA